MRTILMVFCISFPFTIIGRVSPLSLMLMQSALSFSFLVSNLLNMLHAPSIRQWCRSLVQGNLTRDSRDVLYIVTLTLS